MVCIVNKLQSNCSGEKRSAKEAKAVARSNLNGNRGSSGPLPCLLFSNTGRQDALSLLVS